MDNIYRIRNFAIIAHVDHGKSTLADRFLELTGVVKVGAHNEQLLDRNPISRERGITIKLAPVRMVYKISNNQFPSSKQISNFNFQNEKKFVSWDLGFGTSNSEYILNLIDTPGHVDFSYEVDRTLACVEGVILLVDATQGIQAQTISNAYKAIEKNLSLIPVVNKTDLPSADVEGTKKQLVDFLGLDPESNSGQVFEISAKTGQGVSELLESVVKKIPPPNIVEAQKSSLQALIFDSYYDSHRGVIAFVRVFSGRLKKGQKVKLGVRNEVFQVQDVGYFLPDLKSADVLTVSEIGYIATNLKDIHKVEVGDTIIDVKNLSTTISGYKKVKPMVFASIFTTDTADYLSLKKGLEKLYLNDSSLEFSAIHSSALGAGFRVGFLGLLHADVVRERLEREFDLSLVLTPPQVEYKKVNDKLLEPWVKILIITPNQYVGAVMRLCENYRAKFLTMDNKNQIMMKYEMPLSEMIAEFNDNLKSVSSGYASLDWEFFEYRIVEADNLLLLINSEPIEEFSEIVVKDRAIGKAQDLVKRLRDLIPRQLYEIKIQAQYKGKIIASERISPFRKDVLVKGGKVVGTGDVGRKKKLLEKQKEGKRKMKMVGRVQIPKEAFLKLFKRN